jgi:flagellar biosynthetic protein FliP
MIKFILLLLLFSAPSFASDGYIDLITVSPTEGGDKYSANIETLILMTALPFLSAAVIMLTPFMRCVIVFGLLRQALGTMHSPPNQVIVAISLMVSYIIMQPTLDNVYTYAYEPYKAEIIDADKAREVGLSHIKKFWLSVTHDEELLYFAELFDVPKVDDLESLPLKVIIPSFVYSELKMAFKIAFMLFVPFLLIDIVIASTLMGMGMMMLSPMIVSLPFKLCAFVILDGWGLITSSMIGSYGVM